MLMRLAYGYSNKLNHGEAVILGITSAVKFALKIKILKKVNVIKF